MLFTHYALDLGLVAVVCPVVAWLVCKTVRGIRGGHELRRSMWQVVKIKVTWIRLSRMLGLCVEDRSPRFPRTRRFLGRFGQKEHRPDWLAHPRTHFPPMRVKSDQYGVIARVKTIPKVGLAEWQDHTQHLADAWRCARVSVTQQKPGRMVVRAVRRDPLTMGLTHQPTGLPLEDLWSLGIGVDEYGNPVPLRLSGVPGIGVFGLPGYGKTSLLNKLVADLAPSPLVQVALLDGKGEGTRPGADYDETACRAWFASGDDLQAANDFLHRLEQLRTRRAASIRQVLGCKNVWTANSGKPGFTREWPLVFVVMDEVHTFFQQIKGATGEELRRRNTLAAENARLVENIVKKARAVGIVMVLATQKGTGDAIPTEIRDVCPVSMAFACRTSEAAVAALGSDIREYPEAHPVTLQDPAYIGVASMVIEGRPGFTRVRTPYTADGDAGRVSDQYRDLTADPLDLMTDSPLVAVGEAG